MLVAEEAGFGLSAVFGAQMESPCRRLVQFSGEMKVDQIRTGAGDMEARGQLDFSDRAHWLLFWAGVRREKGCLPGPWRWEHGLWMELVYAAKALLVRIPQCSLGAAGSLHRVVPFPKACPFQPLSGTDVSSGGENHASRLCPKLPPGGGRTPGAHFNFPKALLFYCSYLGFYYYCC